MLSGGVGAVVLVGFCAVLLSSNFGAVAGDWCHWGAFAVAGAGCVVGTVVP